MSVRLLTSLALCLTLVACDSTDEFTGPTLDPGWLTSDTGVGSFVGFNGSGQYEVSP